VLQHHQIQGACHRLSQAAQATSQGAQALAAVGAARLGVVERHIFQDWFRLTLV